MIDLGFGIKLSEAKRREGKIDSDFSSLQSLKMVNANTEQ